MTFRPDPTTSPRLRDAVQLQCGKTLQSRLVKAATSEHLGNPRSNDVTRELVQLYDLWARSGCGLVITGNVMVCREALEAQAAPL